MIGLFQKQSRLETHGLEVKKMKIAVGYTRVSTAAQGGEDRFGLKEQREMILKYAAENDILITGWYEDKGISGTTERRPAMDEILYGEPANPPIELVLVAKSDRVARDMKLYYYYMMLMEKKGMSLVSVSEPLVDDGSGMGSIYKALMLFVAEQERRNITMRTSGGRRQKAKHGGYAGGRPPYGYRAENGYLIAIPHEAQIVRKIFELYEDGMRISRIAMLLTEAGIPARRSDIWSAATVTKIIKNRSFYEGHYKYGEIEVEGVHEALIVDGEWAEVTNIE